MIEYPKKEDVELFEPEYPVEMEFTFEEEEKEAVYLDEQLRADIDDNLIFSYFKTDGGRWYHSAIWTANIYKDPAFGMHGEEIFSGWLKEGMHPREALSIILEQENE